MYVWDSCWLDLEDAKPRAQRKKKPIYKISICSNPTKNAAFVQIDVYSSFSESLLLNNCSQLISNGNELWNMELDTATELSTMDNVHPMDADDSVL